MSNLYYIFDTEELAINAEAQISILGCAPVLGKNATTGKIEEEKGKTLRWAIPRQRLDGKWCFPKIPTVVLAQYSTEIIDGFNSAFPYVFKEYDPTWFPQEEV